MRIGLYADPHLTSTSSIIVGKRGEFTGRLDNLIESFQWMNNLFASKGVKDIVCLGDMTDKPNLSAEEITALSRCGVEDHTFLVGNHCRADKDGKINSLSIFRKVVNSPSYYCADDTEVFMLPYNSDVVDLKNLSARPKIILSHNDLKGYDYGGHVSNSGYDIVDIVNSCDLFINGHLHNGGWLVENRVMNLGMLSGVNFASCGGQWDPSVAIVDTETLQVELYENPVAYRFRKVTANTLSEVKGYFDNLPDIGKYVIQIKVPARISQETRQLVDQCSKVEACRVLTIPEPRTPETVVKSTIKFDTTSVYDKLRNFLKTQKPKYSIREITNIINDIEKKEGAD